MLEVAAAKRLGTLLLFQALLYDFSTFLGYNPISHTPGGLQQASSTCGLSRLDEEEMAERRPLPRAVGSSRPTGAPRPLYSVLLGPVRPLYSVNGVILPEWVRGGPVWRLLLRSQDP